MGTSKSTQKFRAEAVIAGLGKAVRQRDLLKLGVSTRQIRLALDDGRIVRVARGYYALPGVEALEIYLARNQARLSCMSKVAELGLWLLNEPAAPHVAAAHGHPIPGCVVHRVMGGQTLLDLLRQCVKCGTELEALVIVESAVVKGKCSIGSLREAFTGREDAAGRAILDLIDPQSMSIAETCGRYHLRKAGYNVQGQAYVKDAGHLDLLVEGVLGVELDGREFHDTASGWEEDLRRDTMFVVNGVWRLRIPAAVALYKPELMLAWVSQALAAIRSTQNPPAVPRGTCRRPEIV
ncbi:hypothetical protein AL755_06015 [Arthrobacter sp. ERGS1:01]|uniref:type IV toxin-antitoxin system AbiEi family antitoxin domain-containing protein n=1 Tax=Arthrobacter sp. ERGS1:01 TaxID=1704044 RepID=UPI0006B68CEB|nr:type IV toxin-antitoxin system AbiEi family antitoxin domain-containing protein [Arthrobacter sp. ERGS1:01]ALE05141.1 hypothetical protein AL755_06015 [Arthrobacter sp. ERGS1:01]